MKKEKYSVNGVDILISCYQELLCITCSPQKDTQFGKGMRKAYNDVTTAIYQRLTRPKRISDEEYKKLAEKLKESCYVWSNNGDRKEEKK